MDTTLIANWQQISEFHSHTAAVNQVITEYRLGRKQGKIKK